MQEAGTLHYDARQEHEHPTRFVNLLVFRDEPAEAMHRATPHVRAYVDTLYSLCDEQPTFQDLDSVAIGLR